MLGEPVEKTIDGVDVDLSAHRLTITAERDLDAISTGRFATPSVGVAWSRDGFDSDIDFVGCAFTQFALPVTAGRDLDFDFRPAPGLSSPPVVSPLIARVGGDVTLLAPIDNFHEQVIAVTDDGLMWGWHGDLDRVPAGFTSALGIYRGASVTEVLAEWRSDLAIDAGLVRPAANALSTHLSYWTDNGAAYWYRTEADTTITESVVNAVEQLRDDGVPIRAVELDSWFYPHATPRAIAEIGYPDEVPPTGAMTWSPRPDAFVPGTNALAGFAERLDGAPLVLHARHISPESPYVDDSWWVDALAAHPSDPSFFRQWFDDAARWGATVIEQDWMLMYWFGVRELRTEPGRAAQWQRTLNEHARATGVDLLWCMATPADLMLAASLDRVIAVRTCDDYRFAPDPAMLWTWFLTVNRLSNTLGLTAFKDCFFSNPDVDDRSDPIDGDRHAELEALLAALSAGPVGIGDRIGRSDPDIIMRCCDGDGRLRHVDRALAVTDDGIFGGPARGTGLLWATTTSTVDDDVWTYVVAINTAADRQTISDSFELPAAMGERTVYDWRARTTTTRPRIDVTLDARDWALFVVCPPGSTDVGDPTKYVTVEAH